MYAVWGKQVILTTKSSTFKFLYSVEMYGKNLQEIQKIISEFVTVVKFTKTVMTKMAFHAFKNVST